MLIKCLLCYIAGGLTVSVAILILGWITFFNSAEEQEIEEDCGKEQHRQASKLWL